MAATGRALCEHGYANLTMQRIAEESSLTTAAIHYHFDTKEALLSAFLDHLLDRFEQQLTDAETDPGERLETYLDAVFTSSDVGEEDLPVALMELKAQAPYHDFVRDRFIDLDATLRTELETIVADGIEATHFDEADPQEVARHVVTSINGGYVRKVALGENSKATRHLIERYLEKELGWAAKTPPPKEI